MRFDRLVSLAVIICLAGCGTVQTVGRSNEQISKSLSSVDSRCLEMPRIYSGVAFNTCLLNARKPTFQAPIIIYTHCPIPLYMFDFVLSAAADTALLPYTIYTQTQYGNIELTPQLKYIRVDSADTP